MRWALTLLIAIALAGCESIQVVSFNEQRDNQNDFAPRVRRVSGSSMVRVALFRPVVATVLKQTIEADKLYDLWRKEFEGDNGFDLVAQQKVDKAARDEANGKYSFFALGSAQRVSLGGRHAMRKGYDPRQQKIVQVPVLIMTATVESKASGNKRSFSVEGSFLQNLKLLEQLAGKVKQALRG